MARLGSERGTNVMPVRRTLFDDHHVRSKPADAPSSVAGRMGQAGWRAQCTSVDDSGLFGNALSVRGEWSWLA